MARLLASKVRDQFSDTSTAWPTRGSASSSSVVAGLLPPWSQSRTWSCSRNSRTSWTSKRPVRLWPRFEQEPAVTSRTYRVEFTPRAQRNLLAIPSNVQRRLIPKIDALARDPRPAGSKKLAGEENIYRLRVGDYPVLYQIQDRVLLILVVAIGHRREIYRRGSEGGQLLRESRGPVPAGSVKPARKGRSTRAGRAAPAKPRGR